MLKARGWLDALTLMPSVANLILPELSDPIAKEACAPRAVCLSHCRGSMWFVCLFLTWTHRNACAHFMEKHFKEEGRS